MDILIAGFVQCMVIDPHGISSLCTLRMWSNSPISIAKLVERLGIEPRGYLSVFRPPCQRPPLKMFIVCGIEPPHAPMKHILQHTFERDQCSVYCHSPFCNGQHQTKDALTIKMVRGLGLEPSWPQSQCGALPYMLLSGKSQCKRNRTFLPCADLRYHIRGGIEPQQPYQGVLPLHQYIV